VLAAGLVEIFLDCKTYLNTVLAHVYLNPQTANMLTFQFTRYILLPLLATVVNGAFLAKRGVTITVKEHGTRLRANDLLTCLSKFDSSNWHTAYPCGGACWQMGQSLYNSPR
jgi:hypothetical protein